jgi:O-Antigen ligase
MPNADVAENSKPHSLLEWWVTALTAAVIFSRLLTPTEGAPLGDTLWIVQITLAALLVWAFASYRAGAFACRLDWIDGGVCLLGLGQFVAAAMQSASANRRTLTNMVWEWVALLVTWFLLRRLARRSMERRSLVWAILSLAVALAGLGLWQHYFGLAETRREVARLRSEWADLQKTGRPINPREAREWDLAEQRLRTQFVRQRIPMEEGGTARTLWDQRLNSSSEPFGTFGLANTFAGLLVVALVLALALLAELSGTQVSRGRLVGVGTLCGLIAFCLVLTKSRTAYMGLLVGLAVGLAARRGALVSSRKIWWFGGIVVTGLTILAGIAALTGAVDRLVVDESFKSLRYRGEYWVGTWHMLTDDPLRWLTGIGPGSFRSYYLQYKLPQSSEEIADPHNLILDVWANGGLLALGGLFLFLAGGLLPLVCNSRPAVPPPEALSEAKGRRAAGRKRGDSPGRDPIAWGAILASGGVYALGGAFDERMFPLLFGSIVAGAVIIPLRRIDLPGAVYAAGFAALAVHLLGAGGIAMPAITQTMFWLAAIGTAGCRLPAWNCEAASPKAALVSGAGALALYLGCWFSATTPVISTRADLSAAEQAFYEEGKINKAERAWKRAAESDRIDPEPCEWLARFYLQRWLATEDSRDDVFDLLVHWQREAIARQPRNFSAYRALGSAYLTRFDRTQDPKDALRAADEFSNAVVLYPNHAELQSELAEALWRAEQPASARPFAERALQLDAINRQAGHRDKLLSEKRRMLLEEILGAGA